MVVDSGIFRMLVRRSHLASFCLMASASTIAVVEYAMYKPEMLPDSTEDNSGSDNEDVSDSDVDANDEEDGSNNRLIETEEQADAGQRDPFLPAGEKEVTISSGDTLASVITKLGFDKTDVHLASRALSRVFNLRNLKIGQKLVVKGMRDKSGDLALTGIELRPDYKSKIVVSKASTGYSTKKIDIPLRKVVKSISGRISPKSPSHSLKKCGVKASVSAEALRGLSHIADIKSARSPVDFEFLYQDYYDDEGHKVGKSELLYASVFINGKIRRIYKFSYGNTSEFVDANGVILSTVAKSGSMLANPLGIMKVTSPFGVRRHPISGRVKMHKGVDLSANNGTPVRAPASGIVAKAAYYSGYGRYVKIKHAHAISTAYGHLNRIIVRNGQRVMKGQIIGYTGKSGNSTGYHLHYEVLKNGRPINPLTVIGAAPGKLAGERLAKFKKFKRNVNIQVVGLIPASKKESKRNRY